MGIYIRQFSKIESCSTKRLLMRRLEKGDLGDMFSYASDPCVTRWLLWQSHESAEETKRYIEGAMLGYKNNTFYEFAIILAGSGKMIGTCGFASIDEKNSAAELGYVISREYWGNGYATEAASAFLKLGFSDLSLYRIYARYMVENKESEKVMKKLGMKSEGIKRSALFVKGEYRDIGYYSVLRSEYYATPLCDETEIVVKKKRNFWFV